MCCGLMVELGSSERKTVFCRAPLAFRDVIGNCGLLRKTVHVQEQQMKNMLMKDARGGISKDVLGMRGLKGYIFLIADGSRELASSAPSISEVAAQ